MRPSGSKNKREKYAVELYNEEEELISTARCKSYKDIVSKFPIFNHEDNVRAFIRCFSKECKTKKTKRKYGNFKIIKI